MENPIYIALSRQMGLRRQMDVVAHNLANMNTPAFKGEKMIFVEHLSKAQAGFGQPENGRQTVSTLSSAISAKRAICRKAQ